MEKSSLQLFGRGDFALFEKDMLQLAPGQRRHLCLFVSVLLEEQVTDLTVWNIVMSSWRRLANTKPQGMGSSLLEMWLMSITKPKQYLCFENRLGEQLKRRGCEFLPDAIIGLALHPKYGANRDLFQGGHPAVICLVW